MFLRIYSFLFVGILAVYDPFISLGIICNVSTFIYSFIDLTTSFFFFVSLVNCQYYLFREPTLNSVNIFFVFMFSISFISSSNLYHFLPSEFGGFFLLT